MIAVYTVKLLCGSLHLERGKWRRCSESFSLGNYDKEGGRGGGREKKSSIFFLSRMWQISQPASLLAAYDFFFFSSGGMTQTLQETLCSFRDDIGAFLWSKLWTSFKREFCGIGWANCPGDLERLYTYVSFKNGLVG